jgi:dihydrofolate reductase
VRLSLIVAYDRARGIGKSNALPWRLPAELAHFKRTTMGKPIVMGRKTYESIGRPLPGRRNVVISRDFPAREGLEVARTFDEALHVAADAPEVMVIGGGNVYGQALPIAHCVYATEIDHSFDVDTYFPPLTPPGGWRETSRERREPDTANPYAMDFVVYQKR